MSDLRALLGDKWTSEFVEAGPDECWPWTACINKRNGYGQMAVKTEAEVYVMGAHAALGWVTTTGGQP